jgi:glutathione synthase/RimK-type ligase-like ATP-grasp enzyme
LKGHHALNERVFDGIVLLTESDGFFGQRSMPWESMDVNAIISTLSKRFKVSRATYADLANGGLNFPPSIVIHGSSQQPEYKAFVEDILFFLEKSGNHLVPSIHMAKAHENKGYQELYRRLAGITYPAAIYGAKVCELTRNQLKFPLVFKEISGFGSSGVRLVRSERELNLLARPTARYSIGELALAAKKQIGYLVRHYVLRKKNLRPYRNYYSPLKRFLLQEFIPGLTFDFKVLAFHDRLFVLKRYSSRGDFRASGSGIFSYENPPDGLLDYAWALLQAFNEPYLSLDICFDGVNFHLLEFQGLHFGPYTLLNAPVHFVRAGGTWQPTTSRPELETVIAESILGFLDRNSIGNDVSQMRLSPG